MRPGQLPLDEQIPSFLAMRGHNPVLRALFAPAAVMDLPDAPAAVEAEGRGE